uniref:C2H2-type domain-containing protein n=1 Tax=Knipowitschia caucasica TaxID=637954 RepID=A0AAV2J9F7_KNICA
MTYELPEESDSAAAALSSGNQRIMYQTDPRPHFGVAWSSHAPGHPLWDSEGPCWGQRNTEMPNPTHTCPHCHLGLTADTLRWHEVSTHFTLA